MIKGVLLDISGVLYLGNQPLPGAIQALEHLAQTGRPYRLLTNTSRNSSHQVVEKLQRMGFPIDANVVLTAPLAIRAYLQKHDLTPQLIIHPALASEFSGRFKGRPNAVVVCDAGEHFTYDALNKAFQHLMTGAPLLAVGDNRYFRTEDGALHLDVGPFIRALAYAAGVDPIYLGKPAPAFFQMACETMGLPPGEVLMIGDDVEADILGALNAGLKAALVKTGKYQPGDENKLTGHAGIGDSLFSLIDNATQVGK